VFTSQIGSLGWVSGFFEVRAQVDRGLTTVDHLTGYYGYLKTWGVTRAHARRRLAHTRTDVCPGQRGPAHRRGARVRRAEDPTSGHRFTTEVPGHPYAGGRSIRRVAKPEHRRARDAAWELRRRRPSPVLFV
jgi:hypothetical protein